MHNEPDKHTWLKLGQKKVSMLGSEIGVMKMLSPFSVSLLTLSGVNLSVLHMEAYYVRKGLKLRTISCQTPFLTHISKVEWSGQNVCVWYACVES